MNGLQMSGSGSQSLQGPVRESELTRNWNNLVKNIDALEVMGQELSLRLIGVCRPETPSVEGNAKNPTENQTQLGRDFQALSDRIGNIFNHLSNLRDRLEL